VCGYLTVETTEDKIIADKGYFGAYEYSDPIVVNS
jgi:hypothetical protein